MPEEAARKLNKRELKRYAESIVVRQGNDYIKELLRDHKVKLGTSKADFLNNIRSAIDSEILTQEIIEDWLLEVEGWGKQHVYLYRPPEIDTGSVRDRIAASPHSGLLDIPVGWEFPRKLKLTSIVAAADHLSMVWHCGSGSWERDTSKDFPWIEDGDLYEYRAFRGRLDRSVVRFEWRYADPFCAVLVQLPHEGSVHDEAKKQVRQDLADLGLIGEELSGVVLTRSVKASGRAADVVARSTKMMAEGGHVDFVATQEEGIAGVQALREIRRAANEDLFFSADGMFGFSTAPHRALSRAMKVQVFGSESRIRLWAQCKRHDVYYVIEFLWTKNQ